MMTLQVCLDQALRSWILSFGPFARVLSPESFAREIAAQFDEARARYAEPPPA
jgi:predicted DNA-binding transcriptional regulator YafY